MLLKKIRINKLIWLLAFVLAFLITRIPYVGYDEINPDGVNWHYRSEQFIVGLKTGQLEKTFQHYHPGVTLMWIMGSTVELVKQFVPGAQVYNHSNFLTFHYISKLSLVFVQLVLSVYLIYLLSQVFKSYKKAFVSVAIFTFEPFFLGNSRLLHMDVLLALLIIIALTQSYLAITDFKWYKVFLAGLFLALAFLTKSIAIGAILYCLLAGAVITLWMTTGKVNPSTKPNWQHPLIYLLLTLFTFLIATFVLFPAMWREPVYVLTEIFNEGERVGIRKGHEHIFLGKETLNPGVLFYPVVLLMKVSPFTILLVLGAFGLFAHKYLLRGHYRLLLKNLKNNENLAFLAFLTLFYVGYVLVMIYPAKKLDRYMVPVFPYLGILASFTFYKILHRFKNIKVFLGFVLFFAAFYVYPLVSYFPYYFIYTSPVFGSPESANKILAHKSFGLGIPALRDYIFNRYEQSYGQFPTLGMIDTKPMRAIYMNSRIFDIRIAGVGDYDLLILAINEQIPQDIERYFTYDSSVYINGLEYWRIYAKQSR